MYPSLDDMDDVCYIRVFAELRYIHELTTVDTACIYIYIYVVHYMAVVLIWQFGNFGFNR